MKLRVGRREHERIGLAQQLVKLKVQYGAWKAREPVAGDVEVLEVDQHADAFRELGELIVAQTEDSQVLQVPERARERGACEKVAGELQVELGGVRGSEADGGV